MSGKASNLEESEEGEIVDSDEDGIDEKAAERSDEKATELRSNYPLSKEKEAVVQSKKQDTEDISDGEFDDDFDTEPLAVSVVFEEKPFSRDRKALRDNLISRFGHAAVVEERTYISLYLSPAIKSMIKDKDKVGKIDEGKASRKRSNAEFIGEETAKKLKEDPKVELLSGLPVPDQKSVDSAIMVEDNSSLVSTEADNSSSKLYQLLKQSPCDFESSSHSKTETSEFSDEFLNETSGFPVITVKFHDRKFRDYFFKDILSIFENIFGSSCVKSSHELIEVFKSLRVDFEIDTTAYGQREHLRYTVKTKLHTEGEKKKFYGKPMECFNCGGQHNLSDCRYQKNYQVINANREKFRKKKNRRYHTEIEKFSGLGPGFISPELRKALGLGPKQLPRYIYEMRKHGYPPGWLEEARVKHSGVAIYGVDGEVPEEGDEDGEVFEEGDKDKYDMKKIVKYPGFNTPAPPDFVDECEIYGCPPFSEKQDVSHMIKKLAPNAYQAYQKKRMQIKQDSSNSPMPCSSSSLSQDGQGSSSSLSQGGQDSLLTSGVTSPSLKETAVVARLITDAPGTPIRPSISPYSKLPSREKFADNISDVIFFENLPNSTGVYKKVAASVAKVREYTSRHST